MGVCKTGLGTATAVAIASEDVHTGLSAFCVAAIAHVTGLESWGARLAERKLAEALLS